MILAVEEADGWVVVAILGAWYLFGTHLLGGLGLYLLG